MPAPFFFSSCSRGSYLFLSSFTPGQQFTNCRPLATVNFLIALPLLTQASFPSFGLDVFSHEQIPGCSDHRPICNSVDNWAPSEQSLPPLSFLSFFFSLMILTPITFFSPLGKFRLGDRRLSLSSRIFSGPKVCFPPRKGLPEDMAWLLFLQMFVADRH